MPPVGARDRFNNHVSLAIILHHRGAGSQRSVKRIRPRANTTAYRRAGFASLSAATIRPADKIGTRGEGDDSRVARRDRSTIFIRDRHLMSAARIYILALFVSPAAFLSLSASLPVRVLFESYSSPLERRSRKARANDLVASDGRRGGSGRVTYRKLEEAGAVKTYDLSRLALVRGTFSRNDYSVSRATLLLPPVLSRSSVMHVL